VIASLIEQMTDQVDFVCVRSDSTFAESLTIHDERWAYCPSAQTAGHDWRECGGLTAENLKGLLQRFPVERIAREHSTH